MVKTFIHISVLAHVSSTIITSISFYTVEYTKLILGDDSTEFRECTGSIKNNSIFPESQSSHLYELSHTNYVHCHVFNSIRHIFFISTRVKKQNEAKSSIFIEKIELKFLHSADLRGL